MALRRGRSVTKSMALWDQGRRGISRGCKSPSRVVARVFVHVAKREIFDEFDNILTYSRPLITVLNKIDCTGDAWVSGTGVRVNFYY